MRFHITAAVACGAVSASAMTVPSFEKRAARLIDLSPFEANKFKMIPPPPQVLNHTFNTFITSQPASNAAAAGSCTNPAPRIEWRNLGDGDKADFVRAIRCLIDKPSSGQYPGSRSRYEDLVWVHQQQAPGIHGVGHFLPWHRYYVAIFEFLLRDECGYRGQMTWWDETRDAGNFRGAPLFTPAWFGSAPYRTGDAMGTCVDDGAFARVTLHLGPGNAVWDHCLARAVDESLSKIVDGYFVSYCNGFGSFEEMRQCSEPGPHTYGHNAIGGVMSDVVASPGDPVFFMHHGFVDHTWHIWQNADPGNRLYQISGNTIDGRPVTLDTVLSSNGLRPDVRVGDMMDIMGGYLCYRYDY